MSDFVGAGLPTWAYLTRARLMYMSTVCTDTPMRRATDALDMDWNHHSSDVRSCWDSRGATGLRSETRTPAVVGGT